MIVNIDEEICDNFALKHFDEYKKEIEENIKNYIFVDDENIISLITEIVKKDDAFFQQFSERNQEDIKKITDRIAKTLLNLYRKSLNVVQKPKTNNTDWNSEYKKALALYGDEAMAREFVVDRIMKEIGVYIIRAGEILDRAINNNERQ